MARTGLVLTVITVGMTLSCAVSCGGAQELSPPSQRILVIAESEDATQGMLHRFEGSGDSWQQVGSPVPVVFGSGGVGDKVEGDGKSPQGSYALGTAFGYGENAPPGLRIPYLALAPEAVCVDDAASPDYNRILNVPSVEADETGGYSSAERMRRDLAYGDGLYEHGVVVQYNAEGGRDLSTGVGKGSCIFLHVWRTDTSPTAGCTAMSRGDLLELLAWLDPEKEPRLVQGSRAFIENLARTGELPFPVPALPGLPVG
ncbi:MAG: L,D-transpeptidase family protein [Longimicrobiales bacterium]